MKQLLIMRHAKSDWSQEGLSDHDRPLNKRGLRNAPRMGDWLVEQSVVPSLIISSTANRAVSTSELVARQLLAANHRVQIETDRYGYLAGANKWRTIIPNFASSNRGTNETVMIVGHNPGLEQFAFELSGRYESVPTATILHFHLPINKWEEISGLQSGELLAVWRPKEIGVEK